MTSSFFLFLLSLFSPPDSTFTLLSSSNSIPASDDSSSWTIPRTHAPVRADDDADDRHDGDRDCGARGEDGPEADMGRADDDDEDTGNGMQTGVRAVVRVVTGVTMTAGGATLTVGGLVTGLEITT